MGQLSAGQFDLKTLVLCMWSESFGYADKLPGLLFECVRPNTVTPAKAGVQAVFLDSGFRRNDGIIDAVMCRAVTERSRHN